MAKQNSINLDITNNADGFDIAGGTTERKLTFTGADITLTGSGTNTYTYPSSSDTLVARASTDTLTNKTYQFTETAGGADHTVSGITVTMTVDVNGTGFGAAMHVDTDGNLIEADASVATTAPCIGLATETGTGTKIILLQGFIRDDTWTWTVGGILYLSLTTGAMTQTKPSTSGEQVQILGVATHADRAYFKPSMEITAVP